MDEGQVNGMRVSVNGEEHTTEGDTLGQLLQELGVIPERVAVEVNLEVIRKKDFEHYRLKDGDRVEVVSFVGGGERQSPGTKFEIRDNSEF